MRVFLFFLFAMSWVLYAQDPPSFESFKADYDRLQKEVGDAKDRTITIDFNWVESHTQYLMKMVGVRELLLKSQDEVVREATRNIDLQPLIDDIVFVGKRLLVERNVQAWTLDDISPQLRLLSQELNRFEQSGFIGPHELYRPSKILWDLSIIKAVLEHEEFVARVCKDDQVSCKETISAYLEKVSTDTTRAQKWQTRAKEYGRAGSLEQ